MAFVLILCGSTALTIGAGRGFVLAREALGSIVHDGDSTRTGVDEVRALHERKPVRRFAARVGRSIAWPAVAMYGLYLVVGAAELPPA